MEQSSKPKRWLTYHKVAIAIVLVLEAVRLIGFFTGGYSLTYLLFAPIVNFVILYLFYGIYLLLRSVVRKERSW